MPSYFKVFPQTMGLFRGSRGDPADHIFDVELMIEGRQSRVHIETLFRAVNDMDIEEFFRGFEFTALWLPEADTNGDLDAILSLGSNRAGRYPEPEDRPDGAEDAYSGIYGDANAPMIGTPFHRRFYLKKMSNGKAAPAGDALFIQPGGFSANAENIKNLRKIRADYYGHMASEMDDYDVARMIGNKPGYGRHGQPVHPAFDQETHVAKRAIEVDPMLPIWIGLDAGSGSLFPGATFSQRSYSGQWRTFAEIYVGKEQLNTQQLGEEIRRILNERAPNHQRHASGAMICIDPAARDQNAHTQITTAQYVQQYSGVEVQFAPTNDPKIRRTAMDKLFKKMVGPREPAKLIDPDCVGLIQGYAGGFHYAKKGNAVSASPAKNEFSHVCEGDEYAALTVEGIDAANGPFIRPDGAAGHDAPTTLLEN